jgi:hypothetical protein
MSKVMQCDNCGQTSGFVDASGWVTFETRESTLIDPDRADLCSWSCVQAYAQKRHSQNAEKLSAAAAAFAQSFRRKR